MTAIYALIPAAGRGARFNINSDGNSGNKVFTPLRGRPLLHWTVAAFAGHPDIDGIVVVTGADDVGRCRAALQGLNKVLAIVPGGATRQESVSVGLFALGADPDDLVLVHDGARPLVPPEVIGRCIETAHANGSAVAALPVHDTLKRVGPLTPNSGGTGGAFSLPAPPSGAVAPELGAGGATVVAETVDREGLWAVQTPQTFRFQTLLNANVYARDTGFVGTDEASLVEHLGDTPVHLVPGAPENMKVTRPEDLVMAEALLGHRLNVACREVRIGFGYDIHRLAVGRRLVLGGVEIADPQGRGLDGHSDADVLLHALCDALLGAAGLPDIGTLYPNTDPTYAGADSTRLLADVAQRLAEARLGVVNVDMTVIAEAPKIAPYVGQMREIIAGVLGLEPARVGIKATTNEGLGALGRGEGIAAHAVAGIAPL